MIDNKVGTYNFVAEPFHVDFMGRLTMGVLGNQMLIKIDLRQTVSAVHH